MNAYALALAVLNRCAPWFYALATVFAIWLIRQIVRRHKFVKSMEWVPGPPALPLIGNSLSLTGTQEEFYRLLLKCNNDYGPLFRLWVGTRPFIFMGKATDIQPILSSFIHTNKSYEYSFLQEWLGNGLITSAGEHWQRRRKLLTPAFHNNVIENNSAVVLAQTKILIEKLYEYIDQPAFDVTPALKLCALDLICATAMGKEIGAQRDGNSDYVHAVNEISTVLQRRFITPWIKPDFIFKRTSLGKQHDKANAVIRNFVNGVVASKKLEREKISGNEETKNKKAFLDLLLDLEKDTDKISHNEIIDEVNTFMFAGHDTTSTALSWCLYVLGKQPEAQDQIVKEYNQMFPNNYERDSKKVLGLQFMEKCVKEALRLYPIVPLIARDIQQPIQLDKHRVIPAGATVLIHSGILNYDPVYFPNPEKFNPDRFANECMNERHPYSYIPFSAGPRNCIGQRFALMSIKLILGEIFKHFEVRSVDPEESLNLVSDIVLSNRQGIRVTLKKRI